MSTSSNHTKAFVQCFHGKHTVARSRTLLWVYVPFTSILTHAAREPARNNWCGPLQ